MRRSANLTYSRHDDPIRLVRMVKEMAGLRAQLTISFTILASRMGSNSNVMAG